MKTIYIVGAGLVVLYLASSKRAAVSRVATYRPPTTTQSIVKGVSDLAGAAIGKFLSTPASSASSGTYQPDESFDDYTADLFGPGTDG